MGDDRWLSQVRSRSVGIVGFFQSLVVCEFALACPNIYCLTLEKVQLRSVERLRNSSLVSSVPFSVASREQRSWTVRTIPSIWPSIWGQIRGADMHKCQEWSHSIYERVTSRLKSQDTGMRSLTTSDYLRLACLGPFFVWFNEGKDYGFASLNLPSRSQKKAKKRKSCSKHPIKQRYSPLIIFTRRQYDQHFWVHPRKIRLFRKAKHISSQKPFFWTGQVYIFHDIWRME